MQFLDLGRLVGNRGVGRLKSGDLVLDLPGKIVESGLQLSASAGTGFRQLDKRISHDPGHTENE